jgi:hypothetical protein
MHFACAIRRRGDGGCETAAFEAVMASLARAAARAPTSDADDALRPFFVPPS